MAKLLRPWHVVLIACLVYLSVVLITFRDPLEFAWIGSQFDSTLYSRSVEGYDGQFVYYIARDPSTAYTHLDVPAYRFQRIVYPALVWIVSLGGQTPLIAWAMVAIGVAALVGGTALLEWLLVQERVRRWYALSYGLFGGVFIAVRFSTNEPLAYFFALAGLAALKQEKVWQFTVWMALALLTKETTIFFAIGYGLYLLSVRRPVRAVLTGLAILLPFAVWQAILIWKFGSPGLGSGGANATPFELIPFNGMWRIGTDYGLAALVIAGVVLFPAVLLPSIWALWRSGRELIGRRWHPHPYVWMLFTNALIMPFVPLSTYREPFGILRFMPGLVIAVLLYAALRRLRRPLRYTLLWPLFGLRTLG